MLERSMANHIRPTPAETNVHWSSGAESEPFKVVLANVSRKHRTYYSLARENLDAVLRKQRPVILRCPRPNSEGKTGGRSTRYGYEHVGQLRYTCGLVCSLMERLPSSCEADYGFAIVKGAARDYAVFRSVLGSG
ncbi:hypothetical protein FRC09_006886 [Ceratobasidium sp. 395]|nr:hypothetical protein FRC09_006886 [Ceratobasidium sp. 395]